MSNQGRFHIYNFFKTLTKTIKHLLVDLVLRPVVVRAVLYLYCLAHSFESSRGLPLVNSALVFSC